MSASVVHHFGPDLSTVGGMATVIRILTEHRVGGDMVYAHPTWRPRSRRETTSLVATSARTIHKLPAGQVAHFHLSEGGSFVREGYLVALAHRRSLLTVATIHGACFTQFARKFPLLVAMVLRRADLVTCMDPRVLDIVQRHAPDLICEILPNPVVVDATFLPADRTSELVVFSGEIGLRKGADILHRAWQIVAKRRPQARCLMVGPSTDFSPPGTERLELRAAVGAAEMKQIFSSARVIVLPSRAEGMPMVLAEAMSLGRPFVSTPVGGVPELADRGGMLVPVGDVISLADRLTELLADPDLARTMGEHGRQFCLETRDVAIIDGRLRQLYSAATQKH